MSKKKFFVTRPRRPNLAKLIFGIIGVVLRNLYTNDGPRVRQLEREISTLTRVKYVVCMANGTLPLIFLMSRHVPNSRIVTTPFSFVATSSAISNANHHPIWADIDGLTLNISAAAVADILNSEKVDAILATHVFGNLCDSSALGDLAKSHKIPLYYDAAHCMNSNFDNYDILASADACTMSFHATKIFSTGEGGALLTNNQDLAEAARVWRNFGISNGEIVSLGQNAKMSELQAVLGLSNIRSVGAEIRRRAKLRKVYESALRGARVKFHDSPNNSYLPVTFNTQNDLMNVIEKLAGANVYPRRYFFPSLNKVEFFSSDVSNPVSEDVASKILCLPLGTDVNRKVAYMVADIIKETLGDL